MLESLLFSLCVGITRVTGVSWSHWNGEVMEAVVFSPLENWQAFLETFFEKLGKVIVFLEIF